MELERDVHWHIIMYDLHHTDLNLQQSEIRLLPDKICSYWARTNLTNLKHSQKEPS